MAAEIFAAIPASKTYALSRLADQRIQDIEAKLDTLMPNQHMRRRKLEQELEELNAASTCLRRAQEDQIVSLTDKLNKARQPLPGA